ncbi:MAG: AbrB/MazE/SpoVT family DNA-binding domain-containing protein [Anaerolineae bacterium]|jgi:AbrB family looped-hinge helix DNA binding protein
MKEDTILATVRKKGQITIPLEMRRQLGLEEGSVVAFVMTEDGILISPREVLTVQALDRIEQALSEQGISLDELIESGREIREELIEQEYDLQDQTPE